MAAGFRFLRAEGRAEGIDLAQSHGRGFDVKLAGLRQVGLLIEVVHREQGARAFAGRRRQNRRIGQDKATIVKEVAGGADDFRPYPQNGGLPRRAHPQMAMLHQEIDAMLLQRDGIGIIFGDALHHLHAAHVELVAPRRALVGADLPFDDDARFLRQTLDGLKNLGRDRAFRHDSLNQAGAVAKNGEQQLPTLAQVVEPAPNGYGLAFVSANFSDGRDGGGHKLCGFGGWGTASRFRAATAFH